MKIKWDVDDGYISNRPHYDNLDDTDILSCSDEQELEDLIYEFLDEVFSQRVTPTISSVEIGRIYKFWDENKYEE